MNRYKVSSNAVQKLCSVTTVKISRFFCVENLLLFDPENGSHNSMSDNSWGDQLPFNLGKKPGREKKVNSLTFIA